MSIPEPATWLMLICGFGGIGYVIRRRRRSEAGGMTEGGSSPRVSP